MGWAHRRDPAAGGIVERIQCRLFLSDRLLAGLCLRPASEIDLKWLLKFVKLLSTVGTPSPDLMLGNLSRRLRQSLAKWGYPASSKSEIRGAVYVSEQK